jgi:hypothetical protein
LKAATNWVTVVRAFTALQAAGTTTGEPGAVAAITPAAAASAMAVQVNIVHLISGTRISSAHLTNGRRLGRCSAMSPGGKTQQMGDEPTLDQESGDDRDGPPPLFFPLMSAYLSPPTRLQRVVDCAARRIEDFLSWLSRGRPR